MENAMGQITVREFEQKIREKEEVTLVVRAPSNTMVEDYDFDRKAAEGT